MHLDEFAVRVERALLIQSRLRRSGADDRVRGLAEDRANAAGRNDHGLRREGVNLHRAQVHRANAAANLFVVQHGREELPVLVLLYLAFRLIAANLLVECVEKLLSGGRAGKSRAVEQRAAEAAEIQNAFRSAIEGNAHAVEQVDDGRSHLAHGFHGRLVREEVAAVDGVVKVQPGGVAFTLQVLGRVDAALRAHRVRTLNRDDREQVHVAAHFGDL